MEAVIIWGIAFVVGFFRSELSCVNLDVDYMKTRCRTSPAKKAHLKDNSDSEAIEIFWQLCEGYSYVFFIWHVCYMRS